MFCIQIYLTTEEKIAELKQQLSALDLQAVSPLRAIVAGTATDEDTTRLTAIENLAASLREKINVLSNS